MKRFFIMLFVISLSRVYALDYDMFADNQTMQDALIANIKRVQAPVLVGDYILFTASGAARHTGIVFDFENYRHIHSFRRLIRQDSDEDEKAKDTGILFYIMKIPQDIRLIKYRLVIDGLWTADPANPESEFSEVLNLQVSKFFIDRPIEAHSAVTNGATVCFVYEGESGQKIRVGGTFTNWDSFIYELQEVRPGFYRLEIPLPKGEHYYSYYKGMSAFADDTNPERVYTSDGRMASVIRVR
ncbi:glycogen-binding domain-containing protein [Treponema sp. HNW]|uniref:glycogen-binding domain-containing protein n=1 Tax=Treponema sp. HNW TaxID=3116654 RepID=UPI003D0F975E